MVAVKLEGRLGNQLFQYAFIYATAKKLNTRFYLDRSLENFVAAKYFEIRPDFVAPIDETLFAIKGYKNLFSFWLKRGFYRSLQTILFGDNVTTISNELPVSEASAMLQDQRMYVGYFQSANYFNEVSQKLKQTLKVKKEFSNQFATIVGKLPLHTEKIVIHIRRGDYVELNLSLPLSYYKSALNAAGYQNALCIFVSDDKEYVLKEFDYIANKYVSNHTEIIDLQFLMNANVCILSNSSFSWWGAWLNDNLHKKVFAPRHWLGFDKGKEYPIDIAAGLDYHWIDA